MLTFNLIGKGACKASGGKGGGKSQTCPGPFHGSGWATRKRVVHATLAAGLAIAAPAWAGPVYDWRADAQRAAEFTKNAARQEVNERIYRAQERLLGRQVFVAEAMHDREVELLRRHDYDIDQAGRGIPPVTFSRSSRRFRR